MICRHSCIGIVAEAGSVHHVYELGLFMIAVLRAEQHLGFLWCGCAEVIVKAGSSPFMYWKHWAFTLPTLEALETIGICAVDALEALQRIFCHSDTERASKSFV